MLHTHSYMERKFNRSDSGEIIGIEPVSVREQMEYRKDNIQVPFSYDTTLNTETEVKSRLRDYPPFFSRLFGSVMSYFSPRIWRGGKK